ncbi:MAG: hypothetical protein EZS28_046554, partial [Streblomastix strix]
MPVVKIKYLVGTQEIDYNGNGIIGDSIVVDNKTITYYRDNDEGFKDKIGFKVEVSSLNNLYPTVFNNDNSSYQWYVTKNPEFANNPDKESECIVVEHPDIGNHTAHDPDYGKHDHFEPYIDLLPDEQNEAKNNGGYITFYYYCKVTPKQLDSNWPSADQLSIKSKVVMIKIKAARELQAPIIPPESALQQALMKLQ